MPAAASTRLGLVGPAGGDNLTIGDDQIRDMVAQLEAVALGYATGTSGSRPAAAAGNAKYLYFATDTGVISWSTGSSWTDLNPKDAAAGTASMRTLGTGSAQAAAGDHLHTGVYQPLDADLTAIAALATDPVGLALLTKTSIANILTYLGVSGFVQTLIDDADAATARATLGVAEMPIGTMIPYVGSADPTTPTLTSGIVTGPTTNGVWILADGRLIDKTAFATFFARAGHVYNGGADPGSNACRIPDKRGRTSVGADDFGTTRGPASVLTAVSGVGIAKTRGSRDGAQRHTLAAGESGVNGSGSAASAATGISINGSGSGDYIDSVGNHSHTVYIVGNGGGNNGQPFISTGTNSPTRVDGLTGSDVNGGHNHTFHDPSHGHSVSDPNHSHTLTARTADSSHNSMQPYEVDYWIVRIA